MRETRQSGSEGGVEFKPPSLPLFTLRTFGPKLEQCNWKGARGMNCLANP
jgi:hypothetical protein